MKFLGMTLMAISLLILAALFWVLHITVLGPGEARVTAGYVYLDGRYYRLTGCLWDGPPPDGIYGTTRDQDGTAEGSITFYNIGPTGNREVLTTCSVVEVR